MKERKQTHRRLFTQFSPTRPTLEERLISPIHYQRVLTKRLQNGLQEIGTKAHNEQNLNLPIFFPISPNERHSMNFHSPKVFTMFPNPREL